MTPLTSWRLRLIARSAGYAVIVGLVIGVLAFLVRTKNAWLIQFDDDVIKSLTDITRAHSGLLSFWLFWQTIALPVNDYVVVAIPACLVAFFAFRLRTRALWAFATMMTGWFLALVVKEVVKRARPIVAEPVSHAPGYSFPSGHASNAAIISTALVLLFWPLLGRAGRWIAVGLGATWTIVTCFDRMFLGVHFPSDVTAGVLLGCGLVLASYAGYRGWTPKDLAPDQES